MRLFQLRTSLEPDRPRIDCENTDFGRYDWLEIGKVLRGEKGIEKYPSEIRVPTQYANATKTVGWHFFSNPGLLGIFSKKLLSAIGESSLFGLQAFPVFVDGIEYYHLRINAQTDWIDFDRSSFSRTEEGVILKVKKLVLFEDVVPDECVFVNQRLAKLFVTERVAQRLIDLDGIRLVPLLVE